MYSNEATKKPKNLLMPLLIILVVVLLLAGIFVAIIYIYNTKNQKQGTSKTQDASNTAPVLEDETSWVTYTRAGLYSVKVPPILIRPGNQTGLEERSGFSLSGDLETDANGNTTANYDPNLFSTIWEEPNSNGETAKQAVEAEKANIVSFSTNNPQTIKETAVSFNGNPGYEGVWAYSDQNSQLSYVYAVAASIKNNKLFFISLTVSSQTLAGAQQGWSQYSYLFDKMISSFIFL